MAKLEVKHGFPGKSASDCYQAGLRMVGAAGYSIFKKREIANLIICEGRLMGNPVNLNLVVPFGSPTQVILSLESSLEDKEALNSEAVRLLGLLEHEVNSPH
jgi:hypothetical protein